MKKKMGFDRDEKFRGWLNRQFVLIKRTSGIWSVAMLVVNLSLTIFGLIAYRGLDSRLFIPALVITMGLIIWITSYIYYHKGQMFRTEKAGEVYLNPYDVSNFKPWEEFVVYRTTLIPMLEGIHAITPEGKTKKHLAEKIAKLKKWVDLGYIPKKELPKYLQKYYTSKHEKRL